MRFIGVTDAAVLGGGYLSGEDERGGRGGAEAAAGREDAFSSFI